MNWLVGCFGIKRPFETVFQRIIGPPPKRKGERKEKRQIKEIMSKQPSPAPTASVIGPCPTIIPTSRTPGH